MAENESWVNQPQNSWPPGGQSIIPPGGGGQSFVTVNRQTETPPNTPHLPTGPPPDTPPTTTITTTQIAASLALYGPIDDCMRSVTVTPMVSYLKMPDGPIVFDVFVNGVWAGSANAQLDPRYDPETSGINLFAEVPLAVCSLKVGDIVQATLTIGNVPNGQSGTFRVVSHVPYSVLTQHYNNTRTGWYPYAGLSWRDPMLTKQLPLLTVASVGDGHISEKIQLPVDSRAYAQPLYMHHQFFPRLGAIDPASGAPFGEAHNAIFLATENDSVIAYDADMLDKQGNPILLWARPGTLNQQLFPNSKLLLSPGFAPITSVLIPQDDLHQPIGISSTPVIDCGCGDDSASGGSGSGSNSGCNCCIDSGSNSNSSSATNCKCCRTATMYVVTKCQRGTDPADPNAPNPTTFHIFLHALDVTTGDDRPNSPVEIAGQVAGTGDASANGKVAFDARYQNNRAGLLLLNGTVYLGFAAHEDGKPYHGWIISYDAVTLEQKNIFCTTADGADGGIWQGGSGIATDGEFIYLTTGNGTFDVNTGGADYGCTVIKLSQESKVQSWFAPSNQAVLNGDADLDLGSGGVLIIPDQLDSSTPLLVTAGKDGQIFLLNRDKLGGYVPPPTGSYGNSPNAIQTIFIRITPTPTYDLKININNSGVWGAPAYCEIPANGNMPAIGPVVFYCMNSNGNGDFPQLRGFQLINNKLTTLPALDNKAQGFDKGGSIPVISSDQQIPQTAILWVVQRDQGSLSLVAYDASNLNNPLLGPIAYGTTPWISGFPFLEPTVINGKIYVSSNDHVGIFF